MKSVLADPVSVASAADGVRNCTGAIESLEPAVMAWQHLDHARALAEASRIDGAEGDGLPLRGMVVAVKDIFDVAGMPTGNGSSLQMVRIADRDSAAVARLRAGGAVILGKSITTEFACSQPSRTRNPCNILHTPGGSSSGSAAAVAAGMATLALGTQTLGSVIRPASYCGVIGFKPSYGRISRAGVFSLSSSLDTVGIFARCLNDIERAYRFLSGGAPRSAFPGDRPPRFGFFKGPDWERASVDARAAMSAYVEGLRSAGQRVDDVEYPDEFVELTDAARTVHDFEVGQRFIVERMAHAGQLSAHMHVILDRSTLISSTDYERAVRVGEFCRRAYELRFARWDALISLAATGEAPIGNSTTGDPIMSTPWTYLHFPCLSLPKLTGARGMPIGVQLVAPRFRDMSLLDAAAFLK